MGTKELSVVGIQKFQQALSGAEPTIDNGDGVELLDRVVDTDTGDLWLAMEETAPVWVRGANYSKKFGFPPSIDYTTSLVRGDDTFPKNVFTDVTAPRRISHIRVYCHSSFNTNNVTYKVGDTDDDDGYMTIEAPTSVGWVTTGITLGPYLLAGGKQSIYADINNIVVSRVGSTNTTGVMTLLIFYDNVHPETLLDGYDHRLRYDTDLDSSYEIVAGAASSGTGIGVILCGVYNYPSGGEYDLIFRSTLSEIQSIDQTTSTLATTSSTGIGYSAAISNNILMTKAGSVIYKYDLINIVPITPTVSGIGSNKYWSAGFSNDFEIFFAGGRSFQKYDVMASDQTSIEMVSPVTGNVSASDSGDLSIAASTTIAASNRRYMAFVPFNVNTPIANDYIYVTTNIVPGTMTMVQLSAAFHSGGLAAANDVMAVFLGGLYGEDTYPYTHVVYGTLSKLDFTTSSPNRIDKGNVYACYGTAAVCLGPVTYFLAQVAPTQSYSWADVLNNPRSGAFPESTMLLEMNMTLGTTTFVSSDSVNACMKVFAAAASGS